MDSDYAIRLAMPARRRHRSLRFLLSQPCEESIVEMLLTSGANIHQQDREGNTPLHDAIYGKDIELVKVLLSAGANTSAQNSLGRTALHIAYYSERKKRVRVFSDDTSSFSRFRRHRIG